MRLSAYWLGLGAAVCVSAGVRAAEPPPQLSVEQLQRQLGAPAASAQQAGPGETAPAPGDAPTPGSCEAQNAVTGPDGTCQPRIGHKRGFSLATPGARSATPVPAAHARPAVATAGAAKPPATPTRRPALAHAAPRASSQPGQGHDLLITFANDSAELTEQAKSNARVLAEALKTPALQNARLAIDGHTNAVGSRALNLELSKRRAQALVDYLTTLGVDPSRFDVNGYGFDRPINRRDPRSPENRRVEARRLS